MARVVHVLVGHRKRVGMPMELALGEPLMVINIENVPPGGKTRAGGYKKG